MTADLKKKIEWKIEQIRNAVDMIELEIGYENSSGKRLAWFAGDAAEFAEKLKMLVEESENKN